MAEELADEFKIAMKEWVELKKNLTSARKDLKVLNTREKELNLYIKEYMRIQKIDTCNLRRGKVSLSTKSTRKGLTKDTIRNGLLSFFEGDTQRADAAMEAILDNREITERHVLSVSGLKTQDEE